MRSQTGVPPSSGDAELVAAGEEHAVAPFEQGERLVRGRLPARRDVEVPHLADASARNSGRSRPTAARAPRWRPWRRRARRRDAAASSRRMIRSPPCPRGRRDEHRAACVVRRDVRRGGALRAALRGARAIVREGLPPFEAGFAPFDVCFAARSSCAFGRSDMMGRLCRGRDVTCGANGWCSTHGASHAWRAPRPRAKRATTARQMNTGAPDHRPDGRRVAHHPPAPRRRGAPSDRSRDPARTAAPGVRPTISCPPL
jgi:hypothetical protein